MTVPEPHPLWTKVSKVYLARTSKPTVLQRTSSADLPLALQIALVAHDDHGEIVLVLDPQDLLLECCNFLETLPGCNRVNEQESLAGPHILLPHRGVFFLAGGIENVEQGNLIVNNALLSVGVCDNGLLVYHAVSRGWLISDVPSIVGSYSSTKWLWINWIVRHDLPTPPPPTTTNLYSLRNC